MTVCGVPECEADRYCKGFCVMHYRRFRRWGDPTKTISHEPMTARAQRYSIQRGDCLLWSGSKTRNGYGQVFHKGGARTAHKALWEDVNGPVPEGLELDHMCHNRACVNIKHLRVVTKSQNQQHRLSANANNPTGLRGVRFSSGKWHGEVKHFGVLYKTPRFDTAEAADAAVRDLRNQVFTHSDADRKVTSHE